MSTRAITGPSSSVSASASVTSHSVTSGTTTQATKKEITRLAAMVRDSALKKAPVTPERNARGAKMMTVDVEEPASGRVNSEAAWITRSCQWRSSVSRSRRIMCSTITMASSMMSPTAAAMPPRVMMLKLMWRSLSRSTVTASTAGTVIAAMSMIRALRRKRRRMSAASSEPTSTASRTLPAAAITSLLWSYQVAMCTSEGMCFR